MSVILMERGSLSMACPALYSTPGYLGGCVKLVEFCQTARSLSVPFQEAERVAEQVCNFLERSSMIHHVRGNGMAEPVSRASNHTTCTFEEVLRDPLDMQAPHLEGKCCTTGIENPYRHGVERPEVGGERLAHVLR
jgi:hypothetical protein